MIACVQHLQNFHMEILFSTLGQHLQDTIKESLKNQKDQPNWDTPENITFGLGYGANSYNLTVWQGQQYWVVNSIVK